MSGYIQREDGALLIFDACTVTGFDPQIAVTEHPVQTGRSTSDHAQRAPLMFSLSGTVTDTPFQREGELVERERIENARAFLRACEEQPLLVGTPKSGDYFNCFLLGYPHEVTKAGSVIFEMSFRVVEFPGQETVLLPSPKPKAEPGLTPPEKPSPDKKPIPQGSKEAQELESLLVSARDSSMGNKLADTEIVKAIGLDTLTAPLP